MNGLVEKKTELSASSLPLHELQEIEDELQ